MPVYVKHTAQTSGHVARLVRCAHCQCEYLYWHNLFGTGTALSAEQARELAMKHFLYQLNDMRLCAAVPCPKCLRYQRYMYPVSARAAYSRPWYVGLNSLRLGLLLLGLGAFFYFTMKGGLSIFVGMMLAGAAFGGIGGIVMAIARRMMRSYNPNEREPKQVRAKIAEKLTMTPDAFTASQTEGVQQAYARYAAAAAATGYWPSEKSDQLMIEWWVTSTVLSKGGVCSVQLAPDLRLTVDIPPGTQTMALLDPRRTGPHAVPLRVRMRQLRVHPADAWE